MWGCASNGPDHLGSVFDATEAVEAVEKGTVALTRTYADQRAGILVGSSSMQCMQWALLEFLQSMMCDCLRAPPGHSKSATPAHDKSTQAGVLMRGNRGSTGRRNLPAHLS